MADSELQDLTADTAPASGDIVYVVVDPAGTPLARKMTVENLLKAVHLLSELTTSTTDTDKLLIGNSLEGTWAKYITPENLFKSIVALTVDTAPTTDDVVLTVNNPGGTAASTATLPVPAATVSGMVWYGALGYCYDNGAFAANGMFELVSGGTTVAFFKSARTGWTAAGDKATGFVQTYEV